MSDVGLLLQRCRDLGATLTPVQDRLKVQAPQPLPDDLIRELKESKDRVLAELSWERRNESACWFLEEWRRLSMPEWRAILRQSIADKNRRREAYARWMLREVLGDPDYDGGNER